MPDRPAARLDGLTVLVARPEAQADELCRLIEASGGTALRLPLFGIAPVADMQAAATLLASASNYDRWLFTSVNAVGHAQALSPPSGLCPWPKLAAVGLVTAAALHRLCGTEVLAPIQGDGAAALLAHPALQAVDGARFLIVTGENTLPELEAGLRARGAAVAMLAVYRRIALTPPESVVLEALSRADVAIVSSGESLVRLLELTPPDARPALLSLQLALPSPRVVETARTLGFTRTPWLPQRVSDTAWLELLQLHVGLHHSRNP